MREHTSENRIRVVLADASGVFLQEASRFLRLDHRIRIIGEASSTVEALGLAQDLRPDLVLMDVAMPGMNGFDATRVLKTLAQPPRVVLLAMYGGLEYGNAARQAGAEGLVSKTEIGERLLPLLDQLFREAESVETAQ